MHRGSIKSLAGCTADRYRQDQYWQDVEEAIQLRSPIAQRLNVWEGIRFVSSLAAALLEGLFEHPADYADWICDIQEAERLLHRTLLSESTSASSAEPSSGPATR